MNLENKQVKLMKKIDIRSLLIGILGATCLFLFMGNTISNNSPIEVKIVEIPRGNFDVEIVAQPTIEVKAKNYNGFRIRD